MFPRRPLEEVDPLYDRIASEVVDSAYKIHSALGIGLLENAYEACLVHELVKRGKKAQHQLPVPLEYDGIKVDLGYRIDLLVENELIVEIKTVDFFSPVHIAQIMTYMRLMKKPLGLLINFNEPYFKMAVKRVVLSKL